MNKLIIFIRLIAIFFLQVTVLNNINFAGYVNPYLYVAFLYIFPLNKNQFPFLTFAFFYGLGIDFFEDTGGIHAFALVFVGHFRLFLIKLFFKKTEVDYLLFRLHKQPFGQIFNYVITLTLIHHFILLSLDNFSFRNLGGVFLNTIYSTAFTLVLYFFGIFCLSKKVS
tara:strand:- start:87 stop:590 length:504 start_codon:yes stop_codon:yes gene_type:complete